MFKLSQAAKLEKKVRKTKFIRSAKYDSHRNPFTFVLLLFILRYQFHQQFHLQNSRPMFCIICDLKFQKEEKFYNHVMFSHEKIFEYFCKICDRSFSTKLLLSRHIRMHNEQSVGTKSIPKPSNATNRTDLLCKFCDKLFKRVSRYHKHLTKHEQIKSNDVYTCEQCALIFLNEVKANEHSFELHKNDVGQSTIGKRTLDHALCCEFCENAFFDPNKLIEHKKCHQNIEKPFKCEFCDNEYDAFSKLKTHRNSHAKIIVSFPVQRNYMCDCLNCFKRYRHWSDLQCHQKTAHLINPTIYKCQECDSTFYNSWQFDYHKKSIHSKPSKCEICDRTFQHLMQLKTHIRRVHRKSAKEKTTCSDGNKKRKLKRLTIDINQYLNVENEKLNCKECGKFLPSKNNARSHIEMVHLKIKNHDCSLCGKGFYLRKDYEDHVRVHTNDTPFQCGQCNKKFRTSSLLSEHRKFV